MAERAERDFHDEIEAHLAIETDRLISEGLSPDEARAVARRAFGNVTLVRERHFERSRWLWLDHLLQDWRYALRGAMRQPSVAATIVLTLGLAVAANAALFSVFDGLLFRPLPYQNPDELVYLELKLPPGQSIGDARMRLNQALEESALFAGLARGIPSVALEENSEIVSEWGLRAAAVEPSLFELLRVSPALGRFLSWDDLGAWDPRPVVIGYDVWQRRFGADPAIVDRVVQVPGIRTRSPVQVVGIAPRGFEFPGGSTFWVIGPDVQQRAQPINMPIPEYGRLAAGVTIQQVQSAFPEIDIVSLREHMRPRGGTALGILLGGTLLLMLIAWVQVAALLFARSAGRAGELGVRLALGATHWGLTRQFVAEGLLLAAAAMAAGWIVAPPLTAMVVRLLPAELTIGQVVSPDFRAFVYTLALSLGGILIIGLVPLELVRLSSPLGLLRSTVAGSTRFSGHRARTVLLVAQLTITTLLLYVTGLSIHSFSRVMRTDLGFTPDRVVAFSLPPTTTGPQELPAAVQQARVQEAIASLERLPGVVAVAGGGRVPFKLPRIGGTVLRTASVNGEPIRLRDTRATVGYGKVLGLRLREGRWPDAGQAFGLAVVNRTLAQHLAPFGEVLGQRLSGVGNGASTYTIIGIVDDLVVTDVDEDPQPEVFGFVDQFFSAQIPVLLAKLDANNAALPAIREMYARVFPDVTSKKLLLMEDEARRATTHYRARSILLVALAVFCVPLAILGIAGSLLHAVRQQAREIGIRLALGAEARAIRRPIIKHALVSVAAGLIGGLVAGIGAGRLMAAYLFGVGSADPVTFAAVAALLVTVAWLSALWPAHRAASISPADVLRDA